MMAIKTKAMTSKRKRSVVMVGCTGWAKVSDYQKLGKKSLK
jgi:hypothetical protein